MDNLHLIVIGRKQFATCPDIFGVSRSRVMSSVLPTISRPSSALSSSHPPSHPSPKSLNGGLGNRYLEPPWAHYLPLKCLSPRLQNTMSYGSNNNPFGAHAQQQQLYPAQPDPQQHHTHSFPHLHNPFQHAVAHQAPGALVPGGPAAGPVVPGAAPAPFGGSSQPLNPYGSSYNPAVAASGWRQQPQTYGFSYTASQVQAPQAIEEPAKDEDATYGPLGRARSKIERAMVSDSELSLDLVDKLQQRESLARAVK